MRRPAYIDNSVGESERAALEIFQRVEIDPAIDVVVGAGRGGSNGWGLRGGGKVEVEDGAVAVERVIAGGVANEFRTAEFLRACGHVERVQALDVVNVAIATASLLRLGDDVDRPAAWVNDWRAFDAHFRAIHIGGAGARQISSGHGGDERHRVRARGDKGVLPKLGARVRVERVDRVMHGGDVGHVMFRAADGEIGKVQRLGVSLAVDRRGKKRAKSATRHISRPENRLVGIHARLIVVEQVSRDALLGLGGRLRFGEWQG